MKKWYYLFLFLIPVVVLLFVFLSNISGISGGHIEAFFTIDGSLVDEVTQFYRFISTFLVHLRA